MTSQEILLVKQSWRLLRSLDPVIVGDTFYGKLFTDYPSMRRMFPKDMQQQYRKLMDMISVVVARLEKLDELSDDIAAMAKRHVSYGVTPNQYKMVGAALLWTLAQGLGRDYNPEMEQAWTKCYNTLSNVMMEASGNSPTKISDHCST